MQTKKRISACLTASLILIPLALGASAQAQTSEQQTEQGASVLVPVVPQQVRFTGQLTTRSGDTVEAVFSIYAAQEGGEPLWTETQKVTVDQDGAYTVLLGSATPAGLPQTIFQGGAARWLGISVERAPELQRVLLSSVPYAMKSADAQALAGHPAGDFVTQEQLSAFAQSEAQQAATQAFNPLLSGTITGSGATGRIPEFTGTNTIGSSEIIQVGSNIGISEPTPVATLDVNGSSQIRGTLTLPALGTATSTVGWRSQELEWNASVWSSTAAAAVTPTYKMYAAGVANNTAAAAATLLFTYQLGTGSPSTILSLNSNGSFVTYGGVTAKTPSLATSSAAVNSPFLGLGASAFSSGSSTAVAQTFAWQVIPTGNDTTTPSSNIALLYGSGTATPAPTGLFISSTGLINWATGQTFPITGTGGGTITGITTSSPLIGAGTSGSVALGLDTSALETALNSVYPQLGGPNTFTQNQTMDDVLTVKQEVNANLMNSNTGYQLGGFAFGIGNNATANASLAFSLSPSQTGTGNLGIGPGALTAETTGSNNTAVGLDALIADVQGSQNTAIGDAALQFNTSGTFNTAVGYQAGAGLTGSEIGGAENTYIGFDASPGTSNNLEEATAIGAHATVNESYALILGGTGTDAITVGIGTASPFLDYALDVEATSFAAINGAVVANAGGGNIYLGMTKGAHKFRVDTNGEVFANNGFASSGADFAESVAVRGERSAYEPGDLLAIDTGGTRRLALAHTPYSTLVAGIYSTKPGMLASPHDIDDPRPYTSEVPLAVMGIVPCKATTANGPIQVGDLLVTSSRPGYAMKGRDRRRMLGAVVGKALEPLANGTGVIQVLVTLQ